MSDGLLPEGTAGASVAESGELTCPRCGTANEFECWLVVDVPARPDLAARVADGTLHRMQCISCGNLAVVHAPLLLFKVNPATWLVFSPASESSEENERRDAQGLLTLLRRRLGDAWRNEWLANGLTVLPRPSLGLLLSDRSGRTQVIAADQAAESVWQRYLAERSPDTLDSSIDLWQQALDLAPASPEGQVKCRLGLGRCLAERYGLSGNLADLDAAIEALEPARAATLDGHPLRAPALIVLGNVLADRVKRDARHRQDLDDAIACYEEAASLPGSAIDANTSLINYAGALRDRYVRDRRRSDLDTAISLLQRGIDQSPPSSRQRALALDAAASARLTRYDDIGEAEDLEMAIDAYGQAVALIADDDPDRPAFLHNLAFALSRRHAATGHADDERAATARFRAACENGGHAKLERLVEASVGWARWASERHAWADVVTAAQSGLAAIDAVTNANVLTTDRQSWQRDARGLVMMAAYAAARLGDVPGALCILERHWARQLNRRMDRSTEPLDAIRAVDPELHRRYRTAAATLRAIEAEEVLANLHASDASTPASLSHLRQRFSQATREMDRATAAITQHPGFEQFGAEPKFADLANVVQDGQALAYVCVTAVGSVALVVTRNHDGTTQSEAVWADRFTVADLNALLVDTTGPAATGYMPSLFGRDEQQVAGLDDSLAILLPEVGRRLIAPLATALRQRDIREVTLVAGGFLKLLPLAAAPYLAPAAGGLLRPRCLLDEWTVAFVPSARTLAHVRRAATARQSATPSFLGVSNPLPLPEGFDTLEGTTTEVRTIANRFPPEHRVVLDGPDASLQAVTDAIAGATHVHFACHGVFSPVNPHLSLLVLSDGQPLLLYNVIYNVKWTRTRLAVVSACDSSQIDYRNLPEEAVGLPAGFLQAGVPGVVAALWPVDDDSAVLLMDRFYRYHLGIDGDGPMVPAEALRQAQRWLRDETEYTNPVHWAPFVFHGA